MNSNPLLIEKEIKKEIMATDIYIGIVTEDVSDTSVALIQRDLEECIDIFKRFEKRFSRFLPDNELTRFNDGSGEQVVSEDLYKMLQLSLEYYTKTKGIFDPSVYRYLLYEGYVKSSQEGFVDNEAAILKVGDLGEFSDLKLNTNNVVIKPENLTIELGGIGKGFIVQKVSNFLKEKYTNFIVDAGGDIYCAGANLAAKLDYWAIGVEDPYQPEASLVTMLLKDMSVATSGITRKFWSKGNEKKHHLIDPGNKKSTVNNLLTVTVVAENIIEADVSAKSIFIMGEKKGMQYAKENDLGVYLVKKDKSIQINTIMDKYVWKN